MSNVNSVNVFDFEIDISGARVVIRRTPMCSKCLSDEEVDINVKLLKANLDEIGVKMKQALAAQAKKPLFDRFHKA